jgi:predicted ATPase
MLTRLKVSGFKNLVDVDVRFGPFTCIAGPNAVGKSNLFDAIRFLSATASKTLMEAALAVRSQKASTADVRDLFHRVGDSVSDRMAFEVEMIAPETAVDDLGQQAKATANLLRYTLELRHRANPELAGLRGPLEIVKEELIHLHLKQAGKHLRFDHTPSTWRKTALCVRRRAAPFISTTGEEEKRVITLHEDGGGRGRGISNPATQPRTVLSVANAAESPTVLCARREMESWQLLHLEPAALREPDGLNAPVHLGPNGAHLPSTLYHLARSAGLNAGSQPAPAENVAIAVYCQAASRLSELIDDVTSIGVERDDKRELLTLKVTGRDGAEHPARSLSDGTLRFLALTVLEMDTHAHGVVCLEEPENGIHPERIPAMIRLLQDIATDPDESVGEGNPLRQVIVNTHSPAVVMAVPDESLLVVESRPEGTGQQRFRKAVFSHLPDTWRHRADPEARTAPRGKLLAYLNPVPPPEELSTYGTPRQHHGGLAPRKRRRVADRDDLQLYLPFVAD